MQSGLRKGTWCVEEDNCLRKCIEKYGEGKWHLIPERAGLNRCRKSCRLRWLNYLSPNIKRGKFKEDEDELIIRLHGLLGNRWSLIASKLPGRTANGIKNYWNSHLQKKLLARENGSTEFIKGKATKDTFHKGQVTRLESKWPEPNGTAKDIQIMDLNVTTSSSVSGHDEQFFNDLSFDNQFGEGEMLAFSGLGEGNGSGCIV